MGFRTLVSFISRALSAQLLSENGSAPSNPFDTHLRAAPVSIATKGTRRGIRMIPRVLGGVARKRVPAFLTA